MNYVGEVFNKVEAKIADVEITMLDNYLKATIKVDGFPKIVVPLDKSLDINGITARLSNLLNQTAISKYSVRIILTELPSL